MEKIVSTTGQRVNATIKKFYALFIFSALLVCFSGAQAQTCGFTNFQFQRVTANIHPLVGGFLWKKPSDYDSNPTKYYPTIIYWHGNGTMNNGSQAGLCDIMLEDALPRKIQTGEAIVTINTPGGPVEFMVFCPQYPIYTYNPAFPDSYYPTAGTAAAAIQYFVDNYRVDINRIYVTGMSTGANIVMEYAAASTANASKVAAIAPVSLCSINVTGAGNVSSTNLPVWINHCANDQLCNSSTPTSWTNAINAGNPLPQAKLTLMPAGPNSCNGGNAHNAWPSVYQSSYSVDGLNLFQWMIQFQRNLTVPVKLENYTARLSNGKVYLNWATSKELTAESFTIEKAGADQRYTELKTIPASGNSSRINNYSVIDDNPAAGINYYRLVQTDADQKKTYFEVRKVMDSRAGIQKVVVLPNPVKDELTTFINLKRSQRVTISISDMNGKVLRTRTAVYGEGNTGISIPVTELTSGIYFVRTMGEDFSDVQKVVKQ